MPPVPKKRTSRSRRDKRKSHHALIAPLLSKCENCGQPCLPHRACPHCGFYAGKKVIHTKEEYL